MSTLIAGTSIVAGCAADCPAIPHAPASTTAHAFNCLLVIV
jgi:hypothetical protein